jgi:AraC family transcriptional regulator
MSKPATLHRLPISPPLSPLERVLRHIAASLDQPLSVHSLAAVAGFSPFHFARLFTSQIGESPMNFVRRRRMQLAVARLNESPPPDLVQLAFDCGFESQEAFTRAFKQAMGVTPGRFKRNAIALREMMEMPMNLATGTPKGLALLDGVKQRAAFRVAGLSQPLNRETAAQIPQLWQRLLPRLPLPGQLSGDGYGVCWTGDVESGAMFYLAGFEIAQDAKLPADFASIELPAQTYRVFRLTLDGSSLHPQIQAAMRAIYEVHIPQQGWELSGGPDFETYGPDFNPTRRGETLEFWIPVKG